MATVSPTVVEDIDFFVVNLTNVPADIIAKALVNVKKIDLVFAKLTSDQWRRLFKEMATVSPTVVEEIYLRYVNLTNVPADVIAKALVNVKKIQLIYAELASDQWTSLFKEMTTVSPA